jgi:adenosylmethionine-8-amino-7-oxononanoate aminotransferase
MTVDLQQAARDHLWLHFTRMHGHEPPIIVRGEGCYLYDDKGKRYLDALAGLFAVQVGYSYGEEMGQAALEQMRELPFYTNWSYAHPRAIELAHELAHLAPGDLNRVFFVSGGSEAVESAWKLARQYHQANGERRWKAVARRTAYHGTTLGALSTASPRCARRSSRSFPTRCTCATRTATTGRRTRPRSSSRPSCSKTSRRRSCRPGRRPWRW